MDDRPLATGAPDGHRRSAAEISVAEAEARYHRDRFALYRARVHSGKPTSLPRLQELERAAARAAAWVRHVKGQRSVARLKCSSCRALVWPDGDSADPGGDRCPGCGGSLEAV